MIWREKRNLLIVLGLLLAANTIFFFTYRVQYESRLEAFEEGRDTANAQLAEARRARVAAEQQVAAYRKIERDVTARGIFTSVTDLRRKLMRYIKHYNKTATPIRWSYADPSRRIA